MFVIPEVINTILMGLIFMVIVITIVRPLMLNLVKEYTGPNMQEIIIEEIELKVARRAEQLAKRRADLLEFHRQLALPPPSLYALPEPAVQEAPEDDWDDEEDETIESVEETTEVTAEGQTPTEALAETSPEGESAVQTAEGEGESAEEIPGEGEIEIREGETLADIKARLKKEKEASNKQTIPPELLNNAKSYEDKVGVVRMVVQQDNSRVAAVIRAMIDTSNK
jgi:hypothetical protein